MANDNRLFYAACYSVAMQKYKLKEKSHANVQSEKGILNRQIRSIQTEGQQHTFI